MSQYLSAQVLGNGADSVTTCVATTAQGIGPDGALRMYGISLSGLVASDYFIETEVGLTLTQYKNDIAILEGEVAAEGNPDQRFEVFIVYENRVDGTDWGGGFKHAMGCTPPTDSWSIYTMKPDQSHLLGKGSLAGSLLSRDALPPAASTSDSRWAKGPTTTTALTVQAAGSVGRAPSVAPNSPAPWAT